MNPWYAQLAEDCMAEHDRVCIDGAECKQRKAHTESAYIAPALRHRVEELQGQVAQAEVRRDEGALKVWAAVCDTLQAALRSTQADYVLVPPPPPAASEDTGRSLAESLLRAAWEAAEIPESGVIEPGQRYIARSGGGNFFTLKAVTRMSCRGVIHELRLM